jgi:hypothetical protein
MSATIENPAGGAAVRPFAIPEVPEAELQALRARIAATRWPDPETVTDESQGVPLAMIQELAGYWAADYDWRRCEAKLNVYQEARLRRPDGDAPADAVRRGGLTRRPGRLATGPRGRLGPAGGAGHLGRARAHQPRTPRR